MNTNASVIVAEFGPETRFEVRPAPPAPYRAEQESRFEQLKNGLLASRLQEVWEPELNSVVRRAANEAAAIAWVTPFPVLFFPVLFEEKTAVALEVAERQTAVRQRSRELLAV